MFGCGCIVGEKVKEKKNRHFIFPYLTV